MSSRRLSKAKSETNLLRSDNKDVRFQSDDKSSLIPISDRPNKSKLNRTTSLYNLKESRITKEMREHISQLKREVVDEQTVIKQMKRNHFADLNFARDEEYKKYMTMLQETELKLKKDYLNDVEKEKAFIQKQFEKDLKTVISNKEKQFQIERDSWYSEREQLILKIENANTSAKVMASDDYNKLKNKLERDIFILQEDKRYLEEELKLFQEADRNRVMENKQVHDEHQNDIEKMKKNSVLDSRKQFTEIKQLQNVIEQLEKKLGFEAGTCLRLQMEKDALDEALARLKQADSWDKRSSKSVKGTDFNGLEFDIEGLIMELPVRLSSKPHNDPERILYRKYVEVCSLVRRLDEKNQQLSFRNNELLEECEKGEESIVPLEEKIVKLGNKNMELSQSLRRLESRIKDLQADNNTKDEKLVHLQSLIEKKDKKIKKNKKKENFTSTEEFEDLQRQLCEQLQIIAELRQQTMDKDRRIDVLKKRALSEKHFTSNMKRKSLSLDTLDSPDFLESYEDNKSDDIESIIDENNENKRRLARLNKEHMDLQNAYSLLQRQSFELKDPQRSELQKEALQSDLLVLQATVNELENQLNEKEESERNRAEEKQRNPVVNTQRQQAFTVPANGDYNHYQQTENVPEYQQTENVPEYQQRENVPDHQSTGNVSDNTIMKQIMDENKDLQMKLITSESELVQKTIQLKQLTEEMKELMDQNDLMEFQIEELEAKKMHKSDGKLKLTDADREYLTTDVEDVECDAISVRIALKELEINNQHYLSMVEKRTLAQARALVDKGALELTMLEDQNKTLSMKLSNVELKYNNAIERLEQKIDDARNEKAISEENYLTSFGDIESSSKKRRSSSLDIGFGFDKNPQELLQDARMKISDLERTNDILLRKIQSMEGSQVDLTEEDISLLRKRIDQMRDAEKKINILQLTNDDLTRRLNKFEKDEEKHLRKNNENSKSKIPVKISKEIENLRRENQGLTDELGTLRTRAEDALAIARKTKEVLNKDDRATQTPSFEFLDFTYSPSKPMVESPLKVSAACQTKITPRCHLDHEIIEKHVVEEMRAEAVIQKFVEYEPQVEMVHIQSNEMIDSTLDETISGEKLYSPNEEQLNSDNEFIQSILQEYDDHRYNKDQNKESCEISNRPRNISTDQQNIYNKEQNKKRCEIINRPSNSASGQQNRYVEDPNIENCEVTNRPPSIDSVQQNINAFDVYLNETIQHEANKSSDHPFSNFSSDQETPKQENSYRSQISRHKSPRSVLSYQKSTAVEGKKLSVDSQGISITASSELSHNNEGYGLKEVTQVPINVSVQDHPYTAKVQPPSNCSTCGLTPPHPSFRHVHSNEPPHRNYAQDHSIEPLAYYPPQYIPRSYSAQDHRPAAVLGQKVFNLSDSSIQQPSIAINNTLYGIVNNERPIFSPASSNDHVIGYTNQKQEYLFDSQSPETSLSNVEADIKDLFAYGRHLKAGDLDDITVLRSLQNSPQVDTVRYTESSNLTFKPEINDGSKNVNNTNNSAYVPTIDNTYRIRAPVLIPVKNNLRTNEENRTEFNVQYANSANYVSHNIHDEYQELPQPIAEEQNVVSYCQVEENTPHPLSKHTCCCDIDSGIGSMPRDTHQHKCMKKSRYWSPRHAPTRYKYGEVSANDVNYVSHNQCTQQCDNNSDDTSNDCDSIPKEERGRELKENPPDLHSEFISSPTNGCSTPDINFDSKIEDNTMMYPLDNDNIFTDQQQRVYTVSNRNNTLNSNYHNSHARARTAESKQQIYDQIIFSDRPTNNKNKRRNSIPQEKKLIKTNRSVNNNGNNVSKQLEFKNKQPLNGVVSKQHASSDKHIVQSKEVVTNHQTSVPAPKTTTNKSSTRNIPIEYKMADPSSDLPIYFKSLEVSDNEVKIVNTENIPTRRGRNNDLKSYNLPQPRRSFSHSPSSSRKRRFRSRSRSPIRLSAIKNNENNPLIISSQKFSSDTDISKRSDKSFYNEPSIEVLAKPRMLPQPNQTTNQKVLNLPENPIHSEKRQRLDQLIIDADKRLNENIVYGEVSQEINNTYAEEDMWHTRKEIKYLQEKCDSLERQLECRDDILNNMQHELKEEVENIHLIEKKDKEIHLKSESISYITQMLQKTKKELEIKISECTRRESEVKHLKQELKSVLNEKKKIEYSHSEQQITIVKLESVETRLQQLTVKYDEVVVSNCELLERIKTLEISEREFIDLERNVIDLQVQLRDMEDIELHRDELFQKLRYVKKQRDEFLEKGKMVEEERNDYVRSNKTLEQYLAEWKRKTIEFKKTNQALKDRIFCLEKDKKDLEDRVICLQEERVIIQTNLNKCEIERDDYIRELKEVTLERNTLEQRLADLEDMLGDYDQLEEGFHSLRLKVAELTRQRDDAELLIPSYKGKLQLLKKHLHEKEDTIMQLSHDLKTLRIAIENSTFDDISKIKSLNCLSSDSSLPQIPSKFKGPKGYFNDHHHHAPSNSQFRPSDFELSTDSDVYDQVMVRPGGQYESCSDDSYIPQRRPCGKVESRTCVALFDYDPFRSSTSNHPERELRLKEGTYITVYGEMDIDGYLEAEVDGMRGLVPSIYVEDISDNESTTCMKRHRHEPSCYTDVGEENARMFRVLYNYDPYTMGTSDCLDRHLSLRKGETVAVLGNMDSDGYYEALLNGKRGLIPSNFVKEYSSGSSSHHQHQQHNVEQTSNCQGTIEVETETGPPYAPRDLKVVRVVTRNAVLLGWGLPAMDEYGRSNGCRITGYRIWVDGKRKQDCNSASMTKALVDGVDLNGRAEFSIQSVGDNGFCSEKCHFAITGALSALSKDNDCDVGSASNTHVALYDYDPYKSSPNPNPSQELTFHEGDLIRVHDTTRNDGFYGAELNGRRGLVPSNFIERVGMSSSSHGTSYQQQSSSHQQQVSSAYQHDSDSNSRRVQFKSS